jgi:hypothetical protein
MLLFIAATLAMPLPGYSTDPADGCSLAAAYLLDASDELRFGISIDRCGDHWTLTYERFGGREDDGQPIWHALDVLEVRKESTDEVIVSQTCSIGGVEDHGIVVVAQQTDEDWFAEIRAAWRAAPEHGRWVSIDPRTVRCWNEAAGA